MLLSPTQLRGMAITWHAAWPGNSYVVGSSSTLYSFASRIWSFT